MKIAIVALALLLLQAEVAAVVWGGNRANQLIMGMIIKPAPAWDVFTVQPWSSDKNL